MAFGKVIPGDILDLGNAALGADRIRAVNDHAGDEGLAADMHRAHAAQPVGFVGRETGTATPIRMARPWKSGRSNMGSKTGRSFAQG
ncbi:hypothetical protein [Paracoccus sp. IB05]|uniref:hypothetical protein n=1 Tax=Paracoccus sp. IB05 TaxID=2779367 RepID=UPI0018E6FBAD|nr:hypothetical protein [Paracoccus sp. IB05]MBJ2150585.1 hypothetical protein [Paracoccus sp. IB05]